MPEAVVVTDVHRHVIRIRVPVAGTTVVDPGCDTETGIGALAAGLAQRDRAWKNIRSVVVTHAHFDHAGLAGRLQRDGATLVMERWEPATLAGGPRITDDAMITGDTVLPVGDLGLDSAGSTRTTT